MQVLDFVDPKMVAAIQILAALGIAGFWMTWLRAEHDEPWLPTGYVEHERCFVYPDSVLAVLMLVSAILLILGNAMGERLTLVCGGMMLFLVVIDTAYFLQNGMFASEKKGAGNVGLIVALTIVSLLMILRFL